MFLYCCFSKQTGRNMIAHYDNPYELDLKKNDLQFCLKFLTIRPVHSHPQFSPAQLPVRTNAQTSALLHEQLVCTRLNFKCTICKYKQTYRAMECTHKNRVWNSSAK